MPWSVFSWHQVMDTDCQLARLYEVYVNSTSSVNTTAAQNVRANATQEIALHRSLANDYSQAVLDLHWDPARAWFYVSHTDTD
jgi:alpha,alpha-trehalase